MALSTVARGYGWRHQALRRSFASVVAGGSCRCARCGVVIGPDEPWDLDHRDDRRGYLGASHRRCNRATNRGHRPRVSVVL